MAGKVGGIHSGEGKPKVSLLSKPLELQHCFVPFSKAARQRSKNAFPQTSRITNLCRIATYLESVLFLIVAEKGVRIRRDEVLRAGVREHVSAISDLIPGQRPRSEPVLLRRKSL